MLMISITIQYFIQEIKAKVTKYLSKGVSRGHPYIKDCFSSKVNYKKWNKVVTCSETAITNIN